MTLPQTGPLPHLSLEKARWALQEEAIPVPDGTVVTFTALEFTSICPRTGQPDFGQVEIKYESSGKGLESKSLKVYLWAYRDQGVFCETLANMIFRDVHSAINPLRLVVKVSQAVRGGIQLSAEVRGSEVREP